MSPYRLSNIHDPEILLVVPEDDDWVHRQVGRLRAYCWHACHRGKWHRDFSKHKQILQIRMLWFKSEMAIDDEHTHKVNFQIFARRTGVGKGKRQR